MRVSLLAALLSLGTTAFIANPARSLAADLHVATNGRDDQAGTKEQPLATLEGARDRIRELKASGDVGPHQVFLNSGRYELTEGFALTEEDSGTPSAPIIYQSVNGAEVKLTGGSLVRGFEPVTDTAILSRLNDAAQTQVLVADLPSQKISDFGELTRRGTNLPVEPAALELFFEGRPMTLAQWPNQGFAKATLSEGKPQTLSGGTPRSWSVAPRDAWVHGFWENDWSDSYERLDSDMALAGELKIATTEKPLQLRNGSRFRILNVLEELDQPGEWYLDRDAGQLYFWPPTPITDGSVEVSLADTVIAFGGASYVTLKGVTIESSRVCGVHIEDGERVIVRDCVLRNIGNIGINVQGGKQHLVSGCSISETGEGAVRLEGGDRQTLEASSHVVENNHLFRFSRTVFAYRPAVNVYGVGNRVANNLIHDGPHAAIQLHGNDHRVEYNDIHSVCQLTDDVGAIYLGQDCTQRGNSIRHNFLHDLGGFSKFGVMAVYLDDFASGTEVIGNVFHRAGRGVAIGGGRDNTIENNVFVDCVAGIQIDNRGRTWAKDFVEGENCQLRQHCEAVKHDSGVYAKSYPALATLLTDEPAVAKGNVVARNVVTCKFPIDLHDGLTAEQVKVADNFVGSDPHFVDAERQDFRLRDTSPAFAIGFVEIPWDQIGRRSTVIKTVAASE